MTTNKRAAIYFIFFTLLIDVIGFGIIIPVMPQLLGQLQNISINEASVYGGFLISIFAAVQFLFSPLIGSLSDKYGRRPILLISLLGFTIDYIILALAPTYAWLVFGRVIAGITGASFTTASAYIADISTDEDRTKNFGMIGAAFGLGFIIGPFLGGLLGAYHLRLPFYAAAVLCFLNFLYGYFILPESLPPEKRREVDWIKANPVTTLKKLANYKGIGWLIIALFLLHVGSHAVQSNWSFFTMYKFNWSMKVIGYSLAIVGFVVGLVQAVVAHKVATKYGVNTAVIYGFILYTIGMFAFAFVPTTMYMFIALVFYCLGGIASPNFMAILSKSVPDNEQGELQGGLTSVASLATIVGPVLMTSTFHFFTSSKAPFIFPGASFLLGGVCMVLSWLIVVYHFAKNKNG